MHLFIHLSRYEYICVSSLPKILNVKGKITNSIYFITSRPGFSHIPVKKTVISLIDIDLCFSSMSDVAEMQTNMQKIKFE